jgi:hypothetical protein
MTAGCEKSGVMEWSVSVFEVVAVLSLPGWLIVEAVMVSLRPATPPSRKGLPRARVGAVPAVPKRVASSVAPGVALMGAPPPAVLPR